MRPYRSLQLAQQPVDLGVGADARCAGRRRTRRSSCTGPGSSAASTPRRSASPAGPAGGTRRSSPGSASPRTRARPGPTAIRLAGGEDLRPHVRGSTPGPRSPRSRRRGSARRSCTSPSPSPVRGPMAGSATANPKRMPASEYDLLKRARDDQVRHAADEQSSPFHSAKSAYASSSTSGPRELAPPAARSAPARTTVPDGEFGFGEEGQVRARRPATGRGSRQSAVNGTVSNRAP